jgi:hypothetical protein
VLPTGHRPVPTNFNFGEFLNDTNPALLQFQSTSKNEKKLSGVFQNKDAVIKATQFITVERHGGNATIIFHGSF